MQPEVPQGNFNLEVLRVYATNLDDSFGANRRRHDLTKKNFNLLDVFLQTNASHATSVFCLWSGEQSGVSTLWELILSLILNCFVVVVEHFDFFKFNQLKLFRTKRQLIRLEPLMKRKANSCPYHKIALLKTTFSPNTEEC